MSASTLTSSRLAPGVTRTAIRPDAASARKASVSAGSGQYFRS